MWGALIYSAFVTWLTHGSGQPLIRLNFEQQRREADFRFSLALLREYGEQVALLSGAAAERGLLRDRFGALIANFYAIVDRRKKLSAFTVSTSSSTRSSPTCWWRRTTFSGQITLGQMTQTAGAFARVSRARCRSSSPPT